MLTTEERMDSSSGPVSFYVTLLDAFLDLVQVLELLMGFELLKKSGRHKLRLGLQKLLVARDHVIEGDSLLFFSF